MPWCDVCGANDLPPSSVEFDDRSRSVRCALCSERARTGQLDVPNIPDKVHYNISLSDTEGLVAKVSVQGVWFTAAIPPTRLKQIVAKKPGKLEAVP